MAGKAKEYFDLPQADRDATDAAKRPEDLLGKVNDYSGRRKLDSSAKEKMQLVGCWNWSDDVSGRYDH